MKNVALRSFQVFYVLLGACLAVPFAAADSPTAATPAAESAAYTFGINMGLQLHQSGVTNEMPTNRIIEGLKDGLAGKGASPADEQQLQAFLRSVVEAITAKNVAAAREFLVRNGKLSGVKTTTHGLQYKIIAAGDTTGNSPQPTDRVTVRYRGTLIDGTEFDSSSRHQSAAPIAVNNTMQGWQEVLSLMKPGAKWQVFVPPELAYGPAPRAGIPGGSLLIFDLELTSVEPAPMPRTP